MNEELVGSASLQVEGTEHSPRRSTLWPWILFVLATYSFDASLPAMLASDLYSWCSALGLLNLAFALFCGAICGQWLMVMVICGLWGRTWLSGYAAAATLLVTAVLVTSLGNLLQAPFFDGSISFTFAPALFASAGFVSGILISSVGIIALRTFRGWRLARRKDKVPHTSFGIGDLIIGTALVALLMIIGNDVKSYGVVAAGAFWEPVVTLGLACCALGLVAVSPIVWLVFRETRLRLLKLLSIVAVNCLTFGIIGGLVSTVSEVTTDPLSTIVALGALWGLVAYCYLIIGLILLRKAGFQLHIQKQVAGTPSVPESRVRRLALPTTLFAALLLTHLVLTVAAITKASRDVQFRQSQRDFAALGGELTHDSDHKVTEVKLWPGATREDLKKLRKYPNLSALSLADSAIADTDLDLILEFSDLNTLDVSGTAITDAGLEKLKKCTYLRRLSLARTKCTAEGIARLLDTGIVYRLDLSDLNLGDDGLLLIKNHSMPYTESFLLSRNPLTNDGVAKFVDGSYALSIELIDCKVDEKCLTSDVYTRLILDGTNITEAGFSAKLAKLVIIETLSLDRTAVTDNILPFFAASSVNTLKLGETQITEEGLSRLGSVSVSQLSLNSRKFTGACFADWRPSLEILDMSHSGVSDANIAHIVKLPSLSQLVLRDTAITDASLELLAKSDLLSIDLCDTRVSAAGLAKHDWDYKELAVTAAQFSEAEFSVLLPLTTFTIVAPAPKTENITAP